jgi:hypothetical protein
MVALSRRGEHRAGSVEFGLKMIHPVKTESVNLGPSPTISSFGFVGCRFKWVTGWSVQFIRINTLIKKRHTHIEYHKKITC